MIGGRRSRTWNSRVRSSWPASRTASSSSPRDSSTTASGCSLRSTSRSRSWRRRSTCSKTASTWPSPGKRPEVRMVRGTTLLPEVKSHYGDLKNYAGGDWRTPETTEWLEDTNPATGQVIARVPLSTKDDVDRAVQEALRAWDAWRGTPPLDPARPFLLLRDPMGQQSEDLARVLVPDMGKKVDEAGVVNLVHGAKETVGAILDHPDIAGVSFVGSSAVAKTVYAKAAASGKRVQAGGGAKNVLVVMPDTKLDKVVSNLVSSCYGCAGERCLAGSVVVGVGDVHADLRRKVSGAAAALKVGYGLDETVQMGPVISADHRERVVGFIDRGEDEGAEVALDGRTVRVPGYEGYFVGPTILDDVRPEMAVAQQEIFGPVANLFAVGGLDDAVELINASPYGNAATIYTSSGKHARDFRHSVRAGNIGINVGVAAPMAYFPFGGMKNSFFGDLHPQSRDAIRFFTDSNVVITRWP